MAGLALIHQPHYMDSSPFTIEFWFWNGIIEEEATFIIVGSCFKIVLSWSGSGTRCFQALSHTSKDSQQCRTAPLTCKCGACRT
eukprot:4382542-Amphidinium_carterae.1